MADEMLQTALINFPGVLLPLLDKCSIDAEDKVARHPFFVDSQRGYAIIKDIEHVRISVHRKIIT